MSVPAPPNQTLPLVQQGIQSDYFMKTKNIPPEMSIEESLGAILIALLFDSFYVFHLFSNFNLYSIPPYLMNVRFGWL